MNATFQRRVTEEVSTYPSSRNRRHRAKKELSPELAALQLPEGKKVKLVRGALKIVDEKKGNQMSNQEMSVEEKKREFEWAAKLGLQIRQDARAKERIRRHLTDAEVLERVAVELKERFLRGKSFQEVMM